ncbi:MAG TPA: ABC transporter ATP-binding protein, partial [Rhizobiales bacterium]|nr:ABC transporter ATP-binding protein [Hyphomicrobiales bacterium]
MSDPVIEARDVTRTFMIGSGFMRAKKPLHAVNGISL